MYETVYFHNATLQHYYFIKQNNTQNAIQQHPHAHFAWKSLETIETVIAQMQKVSRCRQKQLQRILISNGWWRDEIVCSVCVCVCGRVQHSNQFSENNFHTIIVTTSGAVLASRKIYIRNISFAGILVLALETHTRAFLCWTRWKRMNKSAAYIMTNTFSRIIMSCR